MHRIEAGLLTLEQIEARLEQLEALFLVPMDTEEETLVLFLEYIELDNEFDRLTEARDR